MASVVGVLVWVVTAGLLGLSGWWLAPIVEEDDVASFAEWAEQRIEQDIPGSAALALIESGEVVFEYASPNVDKDSLFPAASMSKFLAGIAVMQLVQEGRLELDVPVGTYLTRWQLPPTAFSNEQVTIRSLLSHTSGLTDQLGFGDYLAEEPLPTLEGSLLNPRASANREVEIKVGQEAGAFNYSGGGYLILELVVEEVTGKRFDTYLKEHVFEPMDMQRSTYEYLGTQLNRAESYFPDGTLAPTYQYASKAATGLSTSLQDLVCLVQHLDQNLARDVRVPHAYVFGLPIYGLGAFLYAPTQSGDSVFGHDGGNEPAINTALRINPDNGDAFIMLETGHASLASDIGAEWVLWQTGYPDFRSTERALRSSMLPMMIGAVFVVLIGFLIYRRKPSG